MAHGVMQMWQQANERVELLAPERLAAELDAGGVLLVDVREPSERRDGTIPGSIHVARGFLEWWADPQSPYFRPDGPFGDLDRRVVTFCTGGGNGAFTAVALQELGYRDVATLEGGFWAWSAAGLPVEPVG